MLQTKNEYKHFTNEEVRLMAKEFGFTNLEVFKRVVADKLDIALEDVRTGQTTPFEEFIKEWNKWEEDLYKYE